MFKETRAIIRDSKSMMNKQNNGQKKRNKNNIFPNNSQKT